MKKKILVCDDNVDIADVLKIILEGGGYDVKVLNEGRNIVKEVKRFHPNLLLLDIMLPGIDGKEISLKLKAARETKRLPILVISALNNPKQVAKEAGADGFIAKPFDMNTLLTKVSGFLGKRQVVFQ